MIMIENEYTLATYFILPMMKLNYKSFGENNLLNTYLIKDKKQVVVEVSSKDFVAWKYWEHQNYFTDFDADGKTTIVFNLPHVFNDDFDRYMEGRYTMMSMFAKDAIKQHSGLAWQKPTGEFGYDKGRKYSIVDNDRRLSALDSNTIAFKNLKAAMERELDEVIGDNVELLDKPKSSEFKTL